MTIKIGIICTPSLSDEMWKNEVVEVDVVKRPWLAALPENLMVKKDGKMYTSDDISVAYYIKDKIRMSGSISVISLLDENAKEKLLANDVNFLLIYDILEAFHTLPSEVFKKCKKLLQLPNVFPPYSYQSFINHKNIYYDYLRSKGIPVLPFVYVSEKEFDNDKEGAIERILQMPKGDDDKIIGKPIFGQDSIDYYEFNPPLREDRIEAYMERIFKLYDGCIFQPYISGFKTNGEHKIYFIGDKPIYGVHLIKGEDPRPFSPHEEPEVMEFAQNAFDVLPPVVYKGYTSQRLLTRIDVGCCYGPHKYFVSEVEFVPSLFMDHDAVNDKMVDALLGDQIIAITKDIKTNVKAESSEIVSYNNYIMFMVLILLFIGLSLVAHSIYKPRR